MKTINEMSYEEQLKIVKQNGCTIKYIKNPTEEMKLEAVKEDGRVICYIDNPIDEMKLEAVKQNGWAIQFIDNPTEEMKLVAVKQNGYAIRFIKDPTEEMKLEAVKNTMYASEYIENPCKEVLDYLDSLNIPMKCPKEGSFIGYKKSGYCIVKLEILEDSLRSSAYGNKCRASKVKVLDIYDMYDKDIHVNQVSNIGNFQFTYRVGETYEIEDFNPIRYHECAPGIHFFMKEKDAINY